MVGKIASYFLGELESWLLTVSRQQCHLKAVGGTNHSKENISSFWESDIIYRVSPKKPQSFWIIITFTVWVHFFWYLVHRIEESFNFIINSVLLDKFANNNVKTAAVFPSKPVVPPTRCRSQTISILAANDFRPFLQKIKRLQKHCYSNAKWNFKRWEIPLALL